MASPLKGSYDVAKKNIILCIWCIWCLVFMWFKVKRTHYFPHAVHYCYSTFLKRVDFYRSSSFWEVRCALIGQLSSALWLAEYLKCVTEMLRPLPYSDAVRRDKNNKTHYKRGICCIQRDIITDCNNLYCLFKRRIAWRRVNITMSAFVIEETTNNKHYST